VVVPATVRDDPVVVAVSTGGASPALSRHLRERIEDEIEGAGAMAELTGALRDDLQRREVPPDRRRAAVREVVRSTRVWTNLDSGSTKPRQAAEDVIDDVTGDIT
jgi:precorrin-2 dehydrogenase/sirohydrochlorin ferrochelatase